MPLQWEIVSVPLQGGLDSKTDEKLVLPTKLTKLENGEFVKGISARKRAGYTRQEPRDTEQNQISGLRNVFTRVDEVVVANATKLYSLDESLSRYIPVGVYDPTTHTALEVAYGSAEQTQVSSASVNEITVYAWADSRGGVRGAVYHEATGAVYDADWIVASSDAERPQVVALAGNLVVFYFIPSTDSIFAKVVNTQNVLGSLGNAAVEVLLDVASSGTYDVTSDGTNAYLFYVTDGTVVTGARLAKISASGTVVGLTTVTSGTVLKLAAGYSTVSELVYLLYYIGTTLTAASFDTDLAVSDAAQDVHLGLADVTNLAVAPGGDGDMNAAAETSAADPENHVTRTYISVFTAPSPLLTSYRHAGLAAAGWLMNDSGYFLLSHESRTGVQHSYYLVRVDESVTRVVGRILSGEGIGVIDDNHLSHACTLADGKVLLAVGFRRKLAVRDTTSPDVPGFATFEHKGTRKVLFDPGATPYACTFGNSLYLTGSQLWTYDGVTPVETGFHMFPDMLTGDIADGAAGAVPVGTYSYRVYYEWTTAHGERQRSAAITRSFLVAGNKKVNLTIPTLSFTNKLTSDGRTNVSIVVYRGTVNDATLFYRCSSADVTTAGANNGYLANSPSVNTVPFVDNYTDNELLQQELDYVTLGERPNLAPEGPEFVATVQNRLWLVGGGQHPEQVRYSKLRFDGEAVSFCGFAVTEAPQYGGSAVALGYVNELPVVFKDAAIYALEGEGPDNTGQTGFYRARPVSADTGASTPGSVFSATDGVYFQSPEGISLLTQSLEVEYIGAEVEAYNTQTFTRALSVPNTNQIIWLASGGNTLMFDTYYKQWSVFTNHLGLGATLEGVDYLYLRSSGDLYRRDTSVKTDAGVAFPLKLRTAPLHLKDDIQGFWRCRKLGVVGTYHSAHKLLVGVYYDRDEAPGETFLWEPDNVLELGVWGSESVWGASGTLWGGSRSGRDYRFNHRLQRQKCETIRFEFEDLPNGTTPGAAFELAELTLEVGLRSGLGRLPADRKV